MKLLQQTTYDCYGTTNRQTRRQHHYISSEILYFENKKNESLESIKGKVLRQATAGPRATIRNLNEQA